MDSLSILFISILFIALLLILLVNMRNHQKPFVIVINNLEPTKEGFEDTPQSSPLAQKIQTILKTFTGTKSKELCDLLQFIRKTKIDQALEKKYDETKPIDENLPPQELPSLTQSEAEKKVDAELALQIPGGPLSCPLLKYPKPTATDLEWLDFLQKLPSDFGARVVLMALYTRNTLQKALADIIEIKNEASKITTQEPFISLCPPSVADTRRAERKTKETAGCTLPEDASPQQIKSAVEETLKKLSSEKLSILKGKNIDPLINVDTLVNEAIALKIEIDTEKALLGA